MTNDDINAIAVRLIVLTAKHLRLAPEPERKVYIAKTENEKWPDIVGEFTKLADDLTWLAKFMRATANNATND